MNRLLRYRKMPGSYTNTEATPVACEANPLDGGWQRLVSINLLAIGMFLLPATLAAQDAAAQNRDMDRARALYQQTQYDQAQRILERLPKSTATLELLGRVYYGQGEYSDATGALEDAVKQSPRSSDLYLWLGRAYGRRAETSSFLTAPRYAVKTRQNFEKALELNPANKDAADDLLEYYLQAPGFLGGGMDKAEALAAKMTARDALQGERALAKIAEEKEDYAAAERHLRKAIELDPQQAGRLIDMARFLARRDRVSESDRLFGQAALLAPRDPEVAFARARTYIEQERNLATARELLNAYIAGDLNPDNPSRDEAREWLKKAR